MSELFDIDEEIIMETVMEDVMITMHYGQTLDLDEVIVSYDDEHEGWYTNNYGG